MVTRPRGEELDAFADTRVAKCVCLDAVLLPCAGGKVEPNVLMVSLVLVRIQKKVD